MVGMIKRTKNPFDSTKKVKVYWNLHKDCFSVQQGGLVVGHTEKIVLSGVEFRVSQAGRERVLKEQRKNVHAFITGYITCDTVVGGDAVTYNPYRFKSFVLFADTDQEVHKAKYVSMYTESGRGRILAILKN